MTKYNTHFIKRFSQLNSDMQSYRCKNFSFKQVSGLMRGGGGGGGPDPLDPSPVSTTALVPFDILSTAFGNSKEVHSAPRAKTGGKVILYFN